MKSIFLTLLAAIAFAQPGPPPGGGGASGDGIWRRNAFYGENQTFDACIGHQPQTGDYHHHANPVCLRAQLNDNLDQVKSVRTGVSYREKTTPWTHSPILGWALDGNPIYGPYGFTDPTSATTAVKLLKSSYRVRQITARTSLPNWTLPNHTGVAQQLTSPQYGPPVNAEYPLGRYNEDFEYVAGFGDLDQYNGRQEVTPDFPQGTYAYHIAIDGNGTPVFPYIFAGEFYAAVSGGRAQTVPADGVLEYFNAAAPSTASTDKTPALASWQTKNARQMAQVTSGFDPSAGASTLWPTNIPAGAQYSGGASTAVPADTQRVRYSPSTVYVNANGLASYIMGPWFDATMNGGVFSNFPAAQNYQFQFPRTPAAASTRTSTPLGPCGLWVNGVTVLNFLDGGSYSNAAAKDVGGGMVTPTAIHLSAASNENGPAAPGSILAAYAIFGSSLAATTETASSANWPTTLGGATISIKDSQGVMRPAPIYYASPNQINYRLPADTAIGYATATITNGAASYATHVNVLGSYPNLFLSDATSSASGYLTRVHNGVVTLESLGATIDLGPLGDQVYLVLYGSGLGNATSATATIAGVNATIAYAGAQGTYAGLDQYNILIPPSLAGQGKSAIIVTVSGRPSNAVYVTIQ